MPYIDPEKQREYARRWLAERRAAWFAENGPCAVCGSWDNLELDHIDPALKVSHLVWSWSAERRTAELAKCQALCDRCHQAKTTAQQKKDRCIRGHAFVQDSTGRNRCRECRAMNERNRRKRVGQARIERATDAL